MTKISAAPFASTPINPACRVPVADPNQSGVIISAAASDIARSGSPVVVSLSSLGITTDATNGIDYGATSPAGSTGQEVAINAAIAAVAAGSGGCGATIVWDVAVALGAPIYIPSNTTIYAPNWACGAIMRANTQVPIFRVSGMQNDQTIAANSKKSFGNYDPAHSSSPNFRIFDPTTVNGNNIEIRGGTWNANSAQQPAPTGSNYYNGLYGFITGFAFWGVNGLTIRDCRCFQSVQYFIHAVNCNNVKIDNVDVDQVATTTFGNDCIHLNGPMTNVCITRVRTHCTDDEIAINCDDGTATGLTPGVNWVCSGPITQVTVEDWVIWNGRGNAAPWGGCRLLSTANSIDQVLIRNVRGATSGWSFFMQIFSPIFQTGPGNIGSVVIEDWQVDLTPLSGTGNYGAGVFQIGCVLDNLTIRRSHRLNPQNFPLVAVIDNGVIDTLDVEASHHWNTTGNNVPVVQVAGTVNDLIVRGTSTRDSGVSAGASPAVVVGTFTDPLLGTSTGAVTTCLVDMAMNKVTNMVNVSAGTVTSVILKGLHSNTGSGSPLNVASGATVTNYVYGTVPNGGLVYSHAAIAAVSGTGTVTRNNDYVG